MVWGLVRHHPGPDQLITELRVLDKPLPAVVTDQLARAFIGSIATSHDAGVVFHLVVLLKF